LSLLQERIERARYKEEAVQVEEKDIERSKTPTTITELWNAGEGLFRDLSRAEDEETISPQLCYRIQQYIHEASIRLDLGDQIEKNLRAITTAQAARKARNSQPQRKILGGVYS
jgi:hypothetical protein